MDEAAIKREQPYNEMAEQSVVGSMLIDEAAIEEVADMLTKDDFYNNRYGVLYENMVELNHEGKAVDLITLSDRLRAKNIPDVVSDTNYIKDIIMAVPTSANVKQYAQIVKDRSTMRQVIKLSEKISKSAYTEQDKVDELLEAVEDDIQELARTRNTSKGYVPIQDLVVDVLDRMDEAAKTKGKVIGVPTGFVDLDDALTGMKGSQLILVAARPAMGKTAFVLNIAHYVAVKKNLPCAFFSLEMPSHQLVSRLMAMDSMVNTKAMTTGELAGAELDMVLDSAEVIGSTNLIIEDPSGLSLGALRSKCRKLKEEQDIGLVIIDYLQLMDGNPRVDSRQQQISEISRGLKSLARELDIPIIALSQLNRAAEGRPDHRPVLSDLRESGAIEQDADVILFIFREGYYSAQDQTIDEAERKRRERLAEVIIAKNRSGATGTIPLTWLGEYTKFENTQRKPRQ